MSDPVTTEIPREASPDPVVEKPLDETGSGKTDTKSRPPNTPPSSQSLPTNENKEQHESGDAIGDDLPHKDVGVDEESEIAAALKISAPASNAIGDATAPSEHPIAKNTSEEPAAEIIVSGQEHQDPAKEANGEAQAVKEQKGDARRSIPVSDGVALSTSSGQPAVDEASGISIPAKGAIAIEQLVQSPTKETNGDSAIQSSTPVTERRNGDTVVLGNVRIKEDTALPKPDQGRVDEKHIKVRRSSTLGYIAEKAKPLMFIPRGRVHKRTTASHGRGKSSGGCVIF